MPKKAPASLLDLESGLRLHATRLALGRGQQDFAVLLGVGRTTLANWEGGKLPDVRAMVRLLDAEGVPLEWIYAGMLRRVEAELSEKLRVELSELQRRRATKSNVQANPKVAPLLRHPRRVA